MQKLWIVTAALIVLLLPVVAHSTTITVRRDGTGDFGKLQPAIDAAAVGDTILIGPGRYNEYDRSAHDPDPNHRIADVHTDNLTFRGTDRDAVIIGTEVLPTSTIWDFVTCFDLEGRSARFESMTIENAAYGILDGAALQLQDVILRGHAEVGAISNTSYPMIVKNCIVEDCYAGLMLGKWGVGTEIINTAFLRIYSRAISASYGADIEVRGCTFHLVDGGAKGVAISQDTHAHIVDCQFDFDGVGNGVVLYNSSIADVESCHFGVGFADITVGRLSHLNGTGNVLEGGTLCTIVFADEATANFTRNDIRHSTGPTVLLDHYDLFGEESLDFRHNYWGTDSADSIAAWVHDAQDDPNLAATVLFKPFRRKPYNKKSHFGGLKGGFRGGKAIPHE